MGLFLFVVPGIIWLLKYELSLFIIIDKELSPHESISLSGQITNGYKHKLLALAVMRLSSLFLTWPFASNLQRIGEPNAWIYLSVGIIPYLFAFLVINPWLTAALATAYDVLSKRNDTYGLNLENGLLN